VTRHKSSRAGWTGRALPENVIREVMKAKHLKKNGEKDAGKMLNGMG
jgi:hypothetical protein